MRLGELLLQKKLITSQQLKISLEEQQMSRDFLGLILIRKGFIKEDDLMLVLSEQFHIPYMKLQNSYIDWELASKFSSSLITDGQCLPFKQDKDGIKVAITNPLDALTISQAEQEAKLEKVHLVLVKPSDMTEAIKAFRQYQADKIKKMLG